MPWSSRKTWSVGNALSAADMNTYARDNLFWLGEDAPCVQAVRTATQSIPTGTWTSIQYNATDNFDIGGLHDPVTNNSRLTIPSGADGKYLVTANVLWNANTTGRRLHRFYKNGTLAFPATEMGKDATSGDSAITATAFIPLVAGDYIESQVFQTSGANLDLVPTFTPAHFSAAWIRK